MLLRCGQFFLDVCHVIIHQSSLPFIPLSLLGSLFLAVNIVLEGLLLVLEFAYRIRLLRGESHTFALQGFRRRLYPCGQPVKMSPSVCPSVHVKNKRTVERFFMNFAVIEF